MSNLANPEASAVLPSPREPTHSEDGADLTLIRWMLSLKPRCGCRICKKGLSILRLRHEHTGS